MGRGMDALVAWFVCAVALRGQSSAAAAAKPPRAQAAEQCLLLAPGGAAGGRRGVEWIDISITLQKGVPVFGSPDGLPRNWRTLSNDAKDGDDCDVSWVNVGVHTGTVRPGLRACSHAASHPARSSKAAESLVSAQAAPLCARGLQDCHNPLPAAWCLQHVDAPRHFLPDGPTIETLDLRHLVGPVEVVRVPPGSNITGGGQARSAGMWEPAQSALGSEGCAGCASYLLLSPRQLRGRCHRPLAGPASKLHARRLPGTVPPHLPPFGPPALLPQPRSWRRSACRPAWSV